MPITGLTLSITISYFSDYLILFGYTVVMVLLVVLQRVIVSILLSQVSLEGDRACFCLMPFFRVVPNCVIKAKTVRSRIFIGDQIEECKDLSGLYYMLAFQKVKGHDHWTIIIKN